MNINSTFNYTQPEFFCQDNLLYTAISINKKKSRSGQTPPERLIISKYLITIKFKTNI